MERIKYVSNYAFCQMGDTLLKAVREGRDELIERIV